MPAWFSLPDGVGTLVGIVTLSGSVLGAARWGLPWIRARRSERESIAAVLLGRDEVPANDITGEEAKPAVPAIGVQVAGLIRMVAEVHHELHPNSGTSMKDAVDRTETAIEELRNDVGVVKERQARDYGLLDNHGARLARIEELLAGELHTAHDTIATAAEANRQVLSTVETAIKAQIPEAPGADTPVA